MESYHIPSTWARLIARAVDQLASSVFYLPFASYFIEMMFTENDVLISLPKLFVLFMIPAIYECVFLIFMQRTPGKWLMGLTVVPADDAHGKLRWDHCVSRPLTGRLSLFFSLAIYALAFFRYDRTHLCDWVAGTRVVQAKPRTKRTTIRWVIGSFLVLSCAYDGFLSARKVFDNIDWEYKEADLRGVMHFDESMVEVEI